MDLILGYRHTGKTTKLIEYIVNWQYTHNGPVLFGSPFYSHTREIIHNMRYTGMTGIFHINPNSLETMLGYEHGLLAIDELDSCTDYAKHNLAYIEAIPRYDFVATWSLN